MDTSERNTEPGFNDSVDVFGDGDSNWLEKNTHVSSSESSDSNSSSSENDEPPPKRRRHSRSSSSDYLGYAIQLQEFAPRKGSQDSSVLMDSLDSRQLDPQAGATPLKVSQFCDLHHPSGKVALPSASAPQQLFAEKFSRTDSVHRQSAERTRVVAGKYRPEVSDSPKKLTCQLSRHRRIRHSMGSSSKQQSNKRSLESTSAKVALQLEGNVCGDSSHISGGKGAKNSTVILQSDNKTVVSYIKNQGGTKSKNLLILTNQLLALTDSLNVVLIPHHLPGLYNTEADQISRNRIGTEWHLLDEATNKIFGRWGTPDIDLFTSRRAHVVSDYATLDLLDSSACFHDAFSRCWSYDLAWIFPPPALLPRWSSTGTVMAAEQWRGLQKTLLPILKFNAALNLSRRYLAGNSNSNNT